MSNLVAVAMSGGVDSSVAAALLKESGAEVVGITLQLWPKAAADLDRHHGCCSLDAVEDARRVAAGLDIPYYVIDVQEEFNQRVVEPFLEDYRQGLTPNPCITCNNAVKFDLLLKKARAIGADRLATGHYARVERRDGSWRLLRAIDPGKDQSYVLYGLTQAELAGACFPLGAWRKADVRDKARRLGLVTADKPDSVEICFVTGGDYRELVARRAAPAEASGEIRHADGMALGRHGGIWNFTVGQRSGLGALPRGVEGPLFVLDVDPATRAVTEVGEVSFVAGASMEPAFRAEVRLRYGAEALPALVTLDQDGGAEVVLDRAAGAVAPGQAAVFYAGEEVLGGGRVLRSAVAAPAAGSV